MKEELTPALPSPPRFFSLSAWTRWLLPLCVCAGAAFGTLWGGRCPLLPVERTAELAAGNTRGLENYFWCLWCYAWPCLLAVFLSTTLLGVFLLPALFLLRGFLIAGSVAVLLRCGYSAETACLAVGIPAVFSLTSFFLLGEESFCSAYSIYRTCLDRSRIRYSFVGFDRLLISVLLLSAAALARQFLIPWIL